MKILLVEEEERFSRPLQERLAEAGHEVEVVTSGRQAFYRATTVRCDALVTNVGLPEWDGYKCIEALAVASPRLPVVVWSRAEPAAVRQRLAGVETVAAVVPKSEDPAPVAAAVEGLPAAVGSGVAKLARIVCTLGPASADRGTIGQMILAGMNVARLNFSHGDHAEKTAILRAVREAAAEWGRPVAVLQDLCGPKLRVGEVAGDGVPLRKGARLRLQAEPCAGTAEAVTLNAPEVLADLRAGDPVLLDDGNLELVVDEEGESAVVCRVVTGGTLRSHKGVNLPSSRLSLPSLTEKDRRDLEWGLAQDVDYVALSFVRSAAEVRELQELVRAGGSAARVVAKIEKPEAVERIDAIIEAADGIMVARGDMGVEMRAERVPWIQRDIIRRCARAGKSVITATQMLESMTRLPRPTRAEVTDVAVAVMEGSDAVMLSGETAAGNYPVGAVRTMAGIVREAEAALLADEEAARGEEAVGADGPWRALSARTVAEMVFDYDGTLGESLAKRQRHKPILLVTDDPRLARRSCLWHGVTPVLVSGRGGYAAQGREAVAVARRLGAVRPGDCITVYERRDDPATGLVEEATLHRVCVGAESG